MVLLPEHHRAAIELHKRAKRLGFHLEASAQAKSFIITHKSKPSLKRSFSNSDYVHIFLEGWEQHMKLTVDMKLTSPSLIARHDEPEDELPEGCLEPKPTHEVDFVNADGPE